MRCGQGKPICPRRLLQRLVRRARPHPGATAVATCGPGPPRREVGSSPDAYWADTSATRPGRSSHIEDRRDPIIPAEVFEIVDVIVPRSDQEAALEIDVLLEDGS